MVLIGASDHSSFGRIVVGHALLEGFDAFGDIAHHIRNLAAAAEDQKQYSYNHQPVPTGQRTHKILRPPYAGDEKRLRRDADFSQKLGVGAGKNKHNSVRSPSR